MRKILFLLPIYLFAVGDNQDCIISQKDFPLIHGMVDPMNGEVTYSKIDHVIKGAEPIIIRKYYRSKAPEGALDGGWIFFPELYLESAPGITDINNLIYITDLNGYKHKFYIEKGLGYEHILFRSANNGDQNFYRNTMGQELSARTNPRNMTIELYYKKSAILTLADGTKKYYTFKKKRKKHDCLNGIYNYFLEKEVKPNQNTVHYEYDEFLRLKRIQTKDPSSTKVYATATFIYEDESMGDKNRNFSIWANGKTIGRYKFWRPREECNKPAHDSFFLEETYETFLNTDHKSVNFGYDLGVAEKYDSQKREFYNGKKWKDVYYEQHEIRLPYLTSINEEGNLTRFSYYQVRDNFKIDENQVHIKSSHDHRCNRIKNLSIKNPFFDEKIIKENKENPTKSLYQFSYIFESSKKADKDKKIIQTVVKDCQNDDTSIFTFDNERKPQRMEQIFSNGLDGKNRYVEQFYWDGKEQNQLIQIASVLCRDENDDNSSKTIEYEYFKGGNVKQKKFLGNLTGICEKKCEKKCDEYSRPHDVGKDLCLGKCADRCNRDSYITQYTYSDDGFNMPKTIKDESNLSIDYSYKKGTNLLESKITYDEVTKEVYKREYFEYNVDNILIKKIIDDGKTHNSKFCSNQAGAICKITEITPRTEEVAYNLPDIIEEKYLENGIEHTLLIRKYEYNDQAEVAKEHIHDANNKHLYTLTYEYAENGLLLSKTGPIGRHVKYTYDTENGWIFHRPKIIENTALPFIESYKYDRAGNLQEKQQLGKGLERRFNYGYDIHRLKTSEEDFRGKITTFAYDGKGNQTKQTIQGGNDNHIVKTKYDAFGNVICSIDAEGHKTLMEYNSYGSVTKITYPDNTTECFIYYRNGLLKEHINQEGAVSSYTYDTLGREIKKTISFNDEMLAEEEKRYTGSVLTYSKDAEGNEIYFFYDGAGRVIAQEVSDSITKKVQRTEYASDSLGRQYLEKICNGKNSVITITLKDLVGRDEEIRKEDENGNILSKIKYEYDDFDNLRQEIAYVTENKTLTTFYEYDSFNRIIKKWKNTDKNNAYTTVYNDCFPNAHGKNVLRTIYFDPLHIKTIEEFDVLGRLVALKKKTSEDLLLSSEKMTYDKNGNLTEFVTDVIADGQSLYESKRAYTFDCMNRQKTLTEAKDTPKQRQTTYTYTDTGALETTIKPDDVVLLRKYNKLGHEISLESSDSTVNYSYFYTKLGFLKKSIDNLTGSQTIRELDGQGRVLSEILANNLSIHYEYDLLGRVEKAILPDNSTIEKIYDPLNLKKVIRKNPQGKITYIHRFNEYDLSGNLIEELIFENKPIKYFYDNLGRIKSVNSAFFTQEITKYDSVGKILSQQINNETPIVYTYDDLEQLIEEKGLFEDTYSYDSNFNRLNKNNDSYQINELNQIEATDNIDFGYDNNGNTFHKRSDKNFVLTYDALDRLIEVTVNNHDPIRYEYDSFHRRVKKHIDNQEISFLYDGQNEIGQYSNNKPEKLRILGNTHRAEMGSTVLLELDGKKYVPIHDLTRNIFTLIDFNQNIIESTRYSSFGQQQSTVSESINPWGFQSKRFDSETGFIYFGRRYYDPEIGRWISVDPLSYEAGVNLYAYVFNEPIGRCDLYGLFMLVTMSNPDFQKKFFDSSYFNLEAKDSGKDVTLTGFSSFLAHQTLEEVAGYYSIFSTIRDGIKNLWNSNCSQSCLFPEYGTGIGGEELEGLSYLGHDTIDRVFLTNLAGRYKPGQGRGMSSLLKEAIGEPSLLMAPSSKGLNKIKKCVEKTTRIISNANSKYDFSQLRNAIQKQQAPKSIIRADRGQGFEKPHIHFKGNHALNIDGTWKHGFKKLTRKEKAFLQEYNIVISGD